jgi:hypothetical protein
MERTPAAGKALLILVALCVGAAGCTSYSSYEPGARTAPGATIPPSRAPGASTVRPDDPGFEAPRGAGSVPMASADPRTNPPKARQENAASTVLLEQSRDERAAGSYAEAAASIERALRIDPNNPALWIELAEIKGAEGDLDQAEMMARKALTLAGSDRSIMARAERLLER